MTDLVIEVFKQASVWLTDKDLIFLYGRLETV